MIRIPTVLILGAGASMPYGFPSGADLRKAICLPGNDNAWIYHSLNQFVGIDAEKVQSFAIAFSRSNISSIDSFLAKRLEFTEIGKLAIAAYISAFESPDFIFVEGNTDHWYRGLWNIMLEDLGNINELPQNKIKFISFNYDRSLEYFLHESTKNTFGVHDVHAKNAWSQLEIMHVYGMLGEFDYQPTDGTRIYSKAEDASSLLTAAKGIRVIPEARQDDEKFKLARNWFEWAERICFLGFGFDPLNVDRLGLNSVLDWKRKEQAKSTWIVASLYGKTSAEKAAIQRVLCPKENWVTFNEKNLMTLRESGVLS